MSLIREIMAEVAPEVNELLGDPCQLFNGKTNEPLADEPVPVIFHYNVETYQEGMFAGLVTTASFAKSLPTPVVADLLENTADGKRYEVTGLKAETNSRIEYLVLEQTA